MRDQRRYSLAEVQSIVLDIAAERLYVDRTKLTLETSLVNDLGVDSLDYTELIMDIEERFGVFLNSPRKGESDFEASKRMGTLGNLAELTYKMQQATTP